MMLHPDGTKLHPDGTKSHPADSAPFDLAAIGTGLPFASACDALIDAVAGNDVVVQAPPGTGKTTLVPPTVANAFPGEKIIVTAPRRVAVRAAARRLARLTGTSLGDAVGFTIRGQSRTSPHTIIEFVTPGVLLRRMLRDGDIQARAVILDEVHERGLDTDMALAMLRDLRDIREDLRIIAMSATVDTQRFAQLLDAPIVAAEAPIFPIETRYRPARGPRLDAHGVTPEFLEHVAHEAVAMLDETATLPGVGADGQHPGSVLVFLPGAGEVRRCAEIITGLLDEKSPHSGTVAAEPGAPASQHSPAVEVLELHGRQSAGEQDVVFQPHDCSRRIIVSTAIAESSVTVPGVRGVVDACLARGPRLDISRGFSGLVTTSCAQSSAHQRAGRAGREGPGVVVRCVQASEFQSFPAWPSPEIEVADLTQAMLDAAAWGTPGGEGLPLLTPPPPKHRDAAITLLENLGALEGGVITDLGRQLATMPLHPRLGRALMVAAWYLPKDKVAEAVAQLSGVEQKRLLRIVSQMQEGPSASEGRVASDGRGARAEPGTKDAMALVTALAWPDFIGRKRGNGANEYLFTSGTAARYTGESEWIAASEVTRSPRGAVVRHAVPISKETALFAHRVTTHRSVTVEEKVIAREKEFLGAIELKAVPVQPTAEECQQAWTQWLRDHDLPMDANLVERMNLVHKVLGDPWPQVTTEAMIPLLDLSAPSLPVADTRLLLPWPEASRFDELVPERITMPSGRSFRVDYSANPPVLAVKLQECFGLTETPAIIDGRVPLMLHLLSPAQRPLAVTQDLVSFFSGPYQHVRAEMRGRYPKHAWPENPIA